MPATTRLRSIATVSVPGTLPEKLTAIAAAGFDGVEIFEDDLLKSPVKPIAIRNLADSLGLRIFLLQPFRDFEGVQPEKRNEKLASARRQFDLMNELGCDRLLVCSNTDPESSAERDVQIADLAALAEMAQPHDIHIGFEALAWGKHINRYRQAWDRVREVNHPALGIVLDSFHILAAGDNLDRLDEVPLEKISFLQLADAPFKDMNVQQWSRSYRCYPGQGDLPLVDFVSTLNRKGFTGPWSLEIFNDKTLPLAEGLSSLTELERRMRAYDQTLNA
ncbi:MULTISPECIES: sugar phosphate isomerase/epimerase family protein [Rahnella]|uniref:sugar phosphate isomerase/epimerase family protein n=1 Tax=Rahnella TaxID=34037 RepID=UPI0018A2EB05|nr:MULTISPECIES: sugar phosphate isomerase/epimerase [Rahnella]MBF7997001.1 sugar phosphate isomerase/epimerase [Rahnella laticis]MBV6818526.1 sugar phosphate isomerase/epimerase [Rahnella sp. PD12R]